MPLRQPERVARLLVEKDEALEALAHAHAGAAQSALGAGVGGGGWPLALAEGGGGGATATAGLHAGALRSVLDEQREAYESCMRNLAAELKTQQVDAAQLEALERLSAALEAALSRVHALETRQPDAKARRGRPDSAGRSSVCVVS